MKRVVLIVGLTLVVGAGAAEAAPPLKLVGGSARTAGDQVKGHFVVRKDGARRSAPTRATVLLHSGQRSAPLRRPWIRALTPNERHRVTFSATLPHLLSAGTWAIRVCLAGGCRGLGTTVIAERDGDDPIPGALQSPPASGPVSTVPTDPIAHPVAEPFFHAGGGVEYWGFIPRSYDASNQTPTALFIWLHGCGGEAEGDAWVVDPGAEEGVAQDWMTLSLGGRDGGCWNPLTETEPMVMAALADFETHFNVDRRRVILGGYSSGGDLAYRTGFRHSSTFAGLLIENSSPFRDTESTEAESLAAATTKLHIVHLAHTGDMTYPIEGVREEVGAVKAAGFPIELIERPGGHSDSHTDPDLITYLLPHIDDGWLAPAP